MTAYRHRRCRGCSATFPAGELKPLRFGAGHWHAKGGSLRKCPRCGKTGFTQSFPVVNGTGQRDGAGYIG